MKIKIATWNVNSANARIDNLLFWLKESKPDVVLLQEIKCLDENFPKNLIEDLGYNVTTKGQKSYNGVAILSKFPMEDIIKELPSYGIDEEDEQARYIEAVICVDGGAIRVASIYVPNGGAQLEDGQKNNESDKFIYKMNFFKRLYEHFDKMADYNEFAIFGGDYNVAVSDIDVYDPKSLRNTICFHDDEKVKFRSLLNLGYIDSFRIANPNIQAFSWWDYRGSSFKHNKGMRIDYLLSSPLAADKLISANMEDYMSEKEKPSDHCPVIGVFEV